MRIEAREGRPVEHRVEVGMSIFDLRRAYHDSLSNMRGWLGDATLSGSLTVLDRLSILDAWHQEMVEFFERHGYCFACNRRLDRCRCPKESF
jgi:hypothetical protein